MNFQIVVVSSYAHRAQEWDPALLFGLSRTTVIQVTAALTPNSVLYASMAINADFSWEEVGTRIRDWRRRKGLSQQALADAAGLTQNGIFRLESGQTNPQLSTLQQIATALNCSVRDLVGGSSTTDPILADRFRRVRRIVESNDPAAISIMSNGIEAAELFLERVVRKLREPPLRRIVKGQGRRSPADDLLWMKGSHKGRSETDAKPVADAVHKVGKPFRNSGATHGTSAKSEKH